MYDYCTKLFLCEIYILYKIYKVIDEMFLRMKRGERISIDSKIMKINAIFGLASE